MLSLTAICNEEPRPGEAGATPSSAISSGQGARLQTHPGEFARQIEDEIPFLHRAVRRWHREKADAEDLVQDTLVKALANGHLWQPGTDLRAWLFTIMRNQFLAGAQKSSRFISMLRVFAEADHGAGGDPSETRLELRDVAGALQRLPSPQRTAVMLACVEGKSYEEVAEAMGISVGAVRCHLSRGRNRLRTAMQADEPRSLFARPSAKKSPGTVSPPAFAGTAASPALDAAD
jgi:RNA polymerase sigma-70 factor, ECF subfamily